jgi:hypothetical protein
VRSANAFSNIGTTFERRTRKRSEKAIKPTINSAVCGIKGFAPSAAAQLLKLIKDIVWLFCL